MRVSSFTRHLSINVGNSSVWPPFKHLFGFKFYSLFLSLFRSTFAVHNIWFIFRSTSIRSQIKELLLQSVYFNFNFTKQPKKTHCISDNVYDDDDDDGFKFKYKPGDRKFSEYTQWTNQSVCVRERVREREKSEYELDFMFKCIKTVSSATSWIKVK